MCMHPCLQAPQGRSQVPTVWVSSRPIMDELPKAETRTFKFLPWQGQSRFSFTSVTSPIILLRTGAEVGQLRINRAEQCQQKLQNCVQLSGGSEFLGHMKVQSTPLPGHSYVRSGMASGHCQSNSGTGGQQPVPTTPEKIRPRLEI